MEKSLFVKRDDVGEFFTTERCFITELLNSNDDPDLSIALARVEKGVTTQWHYLDGIIERYLIIEGKGLVETGDGLKQIVAQGDMVLIPSRVRQRITNCGTGDLLFYCVCTPGFTTLRYKEAEE
jgi:mannose-6-phosphate isomerase-like protein (cupin superfamily)